MFTAVPPWISPTVSVAWRGWKGEAGSASRSSRFARSRSTSSRRSASMLADTPKWVRLECASRPLTVTR